MASCEYMYVLEKNVSRSRGRSEKINIANLTQLHGVYQAISPGLSPLTTRPCTIHIQDQDRENQSRVTGQGHVTDIKGGSQSGCGLVNYSGLVGGHGKTIKIVTIIKQYSSVDTHLSHRVTIIIVTTAYKDRAHDSSSVGGKPAD